MKTRNKSSSTDIKITNQRLLRSNWSLANHSFDDLEQLSMEIHFNKDNNVTANCNNNRLARLIDGTQRPRGKRNVSHLTDAEKITRVDNMCDVHSDSSVILVPKEIPIIDLTDSNDDSVTVICHNGNENVVQNSPENIPTLSSSPKLSHESVNLNDCINEFEETLNHLEETQKNDDHNDNRTELTEEDNQIISEIISMDESIQQKSLEEN